MSRSSVESAEPAESGTRSRTRRAILDAAVALLAWDKNATLAQIADAAEVGRSTLHRYFPDRETLRQAAIGDSLRSLEQVHRAAGLDDGPAREGMRRLIAGMLGVGDHLVFLFGDRSTLEEWQDPDCPPGGDPQADDGYGELRDFISRGQREGAFDPRLPPEWIQLTLWSIVYTGVEAAKEGTLPAHRLLDTVVLTFERGVGGPGE